MQDNNNSFKIYNKKIKALNINRLNNGTRFAIVTRL